MTLPPNLEELSLQCAKGNLSNLDFVPSQVEILSIDAGSEGGAVIHNLPSIHTLRLSAQEDQVPFPIKNLPPNLHTLHLNGNYNPEGLSNVLPLSLRELSLRGKFNSKLDSLPPNLVKLTIGKEFSHELPVDLPPTLQILIVDSYIDLTACNFPKRFSCPSLNAIHPSLHLLPFLYHSLLHL